ncbi:anaerobic glycerol-3-phosphate dehydrogenase subunit C [Vibrio sp. SS-MA-C1-2]|uniref:anaerobic glycerol-3-phosphate dehydrogenase subunit GlpC n=1 Tax=Vibrio sp. SS-MA-C1-2 TaxID=2908646 RepID=UPI001F30574F|nr:anaerobic glycerol-3-phosphate dehydrogenase subunit GlpC [Vibrio sp. SS-MA-C1-2]UJF17260.1 anaerobic glycerol-3-phosphate dehydrogenase subunit C [Vibrio sp. SS-MA-C1-2]
MSQTEVIPTTSIDTSFEQCIKCTVCTVYCPVAKANIDYPGPKQCGPDGERLRLKSPELYDETLKYCTNCKRCETACPSNVKIGDIIAVARRKHEKKEISPKFMRDFVLSHTDLFGSLTTPIAPIVNKVTENKVMKKVMEKTVGVSSHKSLPKYSFGTFRRWYKKNKKRQLDFDRHINYFHGCYVNYNHPQLGKDVVKVLNAMGIGMQLLEKEKCCGVPLIANGFFDKAKKNAEFNVAQMEKATSNSSMPILSTSSTCSFTLQQEYPHVLEVDNSKVVDKIEYMSSFMLREFMSGNQPKLKPVNKKVLYHIPCHLERSGQVIFTTELIKMIPGVELVILDSQCCGSAGTYGFKEENYETSMKIGETIFETIKHSKEADLIITDCETCKWQLEENSHLEAIHPMSLMAMAIDD